MIQVKPLLIKYLHLNRSFYLILMKRIPRSHNENFEDVSLLVRAPVNIGREKYGSFFVMGLLTNAGPTAADYLDSILNQMVFFLPFLHIFPVGTNLVIKSYH